MDYDKINIRLKAVRVEIRANVPMLAMQDRLDRELEDIFWYAGVTKNTKMVPIGFPIINVT